MTVPTCNVLKGIEPVVTADPINILTNTNNAPYFETVEFVCAVIANYFACHLILSLFSNNKHMSD